MKKIYFLIYMSVLFLFTFTRCADLDTYPESDKVTDDQKDQVVANDPAKLEADITALYGKLIERDVTYDFSNANAHYDFGYAGLCIAAEHSGMDLVCDDTGYNWFATWANFGNSRIYSSTQAYYPWIFFYSHIKIANDLLKTLPADAAASDAQRAGYRGQALASRAFDYLNLVQMYQFTYKGHENALAVPIVIETTTGDEINNNSRATVQQVYTLIMADLDEAIVLLKDFKRADKGRINQNIAYGLRARANLLMQNWDAAAADADKAMAGFTPYSIADVSKPSFYDANDGSWMWGNIINSTNAVVTSGIVNWPSHMCSMAGNGYASLTGTTRQIYVNLWNKIPTTDVRKGWWVDAKSNSPLTDSLTVTNTKGQVNPAKKHYAWKAYTNVKFGADDGIINNAVMAQDWPMMRVEEMILIKAEGLAMGSSPAQAKTVLEDFVKTYRDPSYTFASSSPQDLQDEIWYQRRVELWGEGFAFQDLLRLKKPLKRFENGVTNHPVNFIFDLPAEAPIFLSRIPQSETNTNKGIPPSANNPLIAKPTPVIPY